MAMEAKEAGRMHRRLMFKGLGLGFALVVLLAALVGAWAFRHYLLSPQALYREVQGAAPERAPVLYGRLGELLPEIDEYARLWAAQAAMPDLDALRTLQAVVAFRPQSPAAYEAHIALAHYYADSDAPQAEDEYRAALELHDSTGIRLELARYLEERGENEAAYGEYKDILSDQPDAFSGMRRAGADRLAVAKDLNAAWYYTDALETLRGVDDREALPLRADALNGLGRYDEAEIAYRAWLEEEPEDSAAELELAAILVLLGQPTEALSICLTLDTADSRLTQAELLEDENPEEALALYLDSPYPVAWWSATTMLEAQERLTETLPVYTWLAESDTYLADDAAYRLHVLAERVGGEKAQSQARELLEELGLNWLALRATGDEVRLDEAPPRAAAGEEIMDKARALESIGREDLAYLELLFAARFRRAPEVDLAMAQALLAGGYVVDAQAIAEEYIDDHPRAPRAFWELSYPRPYTSTVESEAAAFDVDPLLIWAIMRAESRYDPEAYGYAGERGLMQIMPPTQDWASEQLGEVISPGDAFTPEANVHMAAWLLRFLLDYFDGDVELAIAAYNGGAGSVDTWQADPMVSDRDDLLRWIGFGQTREYLEKVSLYHRVYQALYGSESVTE